MQTIFATRFPKLQGLFNLTNDGNWHVRAGGVRFNNIYWIKINYLTWNNRKFINSEELLKVIRYDLGGRSVYVRFAPNSGDVLLDINSFNSGYLHYVITYYKFEQFLKDFDFDGKINWRKEGF